MSNEEIKKYDDRGNCIYCKYSDGWEYWQKYDENNLLIHWRNSNNYEYWREYDNRGNCIHYKNINGDEWWLKYDENYNEIKISKKEFKYIQNKKQEKEYLSRTKVTRFELMDI